MKKTKKKSKKLFYLLVWLLFTAVLLSTTSYAWFTANRIVSVNSLNVRVRSEGGIEISADGTTWKAVLSLEDLINVHDNKYPTSINQIPTLLKPVSTGGTIENGRLKMYDGLVDNNDSGNYILTSSRATEEEGNGEESNGNYIAFDIFLKTAALKKMALTENSKVEYSGDQSYGIENASRIAFLVLGNTPTGSTLDVIQGLNNQSDLYIWEPNYDTHTTSGIANAKDVYGQIVGEKNSPRLPYDGVIDNINRTDNITLSQATATNYPSKFKRINISYSTINNFTSNVEIFSLNSGITKVRVYMWIEGQDVDCENNASVGDMSFTLQFSAVE